MLWSLVRAGRFRFRDVGRRRRRQRNNEKREELI